MLESIVGIIGAALLATIGWAFTLNSRVAVLEADRAGLKELFATQLQDIRNRLERIEDKLDEGSTGENHGATNWRR